MFSPRPRYRFYGTPNNYVTAARHFLASRVLSGGETDHIAMLEERVAGMVGVGHALCVPQARFGIYLALKHLVQPGQTVVMSPYTIYDVVNMVVAAGARPVFADIERETCNIDPAEIERLIDQRTGAVMVTHLHGLACDMDRIAAICAARGVPILEDAAQAFGARASGRMVGGIGRIGVYSFGRAKNVNAFYGGMLVTDDGVLRARIAGELAGLPLEDGARLAKRIAHCLVGDVMTFPAVFSPLTFRIFRLGALNDVKSVNRIVQTESEPVFRDTVPDHYRRRMTPLQARVVYDQLFSVDQQTEIRLAHARRYHDGLAGERGIRLPPMREDGSHIYLQYPVQVDDRWDFVRHMMRHGRDVAIQHMGSAADLDIFAEYRSDCPEARATAETCVLLPTYPGYGMAEVDANVRVIRDYLHARGRGG